jgi:DNA-binding response OmpR family regulator
MSAQARIPLVDDEPAIIEYSAQLLDHSGFEVKTSTDGEKALLKIII